ncbi:nitrite reductase large subunit [Spirosoma taeanense]|uniref:Nitrite reductase large subunit n=1 Tax=Spirosoma taeanense TaxID=2735870 RepID=A0A6M5YEW1_9BACT|nr:nitrite reductase large subunit NirB [Spirosoma taeanense]QJW91813.1 nitrite reductase large subunit [Spirosoma taeanense]
MTNIVVVGNGMVGYKFCEKLLTRPGLAKNNASETDGGRFILTVFGEEPRPAYDRVHLSAYFSGTSADDLAMAPAEWYADNGINLRTSECITHIDRDARIITTHTGETVSYDILVLATGSAPFVPPVPGVQKDGIFVYRTIEDLEAITAWGDQATKAVVIGGGLLGLEAAKAAMDMGLETHVVEFAPRLMPRQLDTAGADMLRQKMEALGIRIHLSKSTVEFEGYNRVTGLRFADDTLLEADMVIISAGIKPRDELARQAGLEVGPRGGIVVNDLLQTSDPSIFAIGECALHGSMIYGLVAPGYEMADIVATEVASVITANDATGGKTFTGFDMSTKLKLIGVDVASFGEPFCEQIPHRTLVYEDKLAGVYKRLNITEDGKHLLGGILVGEAESYNILLQTSKNRIVLPPTPEDLLLPPRKGDAASTSSGVMSLPNEALICSCEGISKGDICSAVTDKELSDVAAIKKCTKAGTGCGGCVPMLNDLLTETLKAQGKIVRKVLCEHFDHTRQELYDLIRINGETTYSDVIRRYGKGHGCEVCKPAVASILASVHNQLIAQQAVIQDTNDRYLANIQRGGTYSVVPRVAGGEITAEKLIALGVVAKKYDLYCKITGGQRIDLFGARVDQLPYIWEELIEAGFESGHAYGKALRTVKSCVGFTWCRFGVQDSVGFAVEVEERYKGLRAPHKLKGGVSGCVRECAEAQGKDFGIIATEKGWNLYVCGNGGAKPQHAQLLASDIDRETCVRYLDRFLMFYVKTAEPLTRTATWLNKLEGGMDYLKSVVIDDVLGLNAQFEAEMEHIVQTYQCEWKSVVENEDLRNQYRHFVNVDEVDSTLAFVPDGRGQKRPVDW